MSDPAACAGRLIITNGDSAAGRIHNLHASALVLPWRDVLHDGRLHATATLTDFAKTRAPFLADMAGMALANVQASFSERDRLFAALPSFERVELWFEHDLYDQLQLAQIIAAASLEHPHVDLWLMQANDFLGAMPDDALAARCPRQAPVTAKERAYAVRVWAALCAARPAALNDLARETAPAPLPWMQQAVRRFLAEYPDRTTGLPRSLTLALQGLPAEPRTIGCLFAHMQQAEAAQFMGDLSFAHLIARVGLCGRPLIAGTDRPLRAWSSCDDRAFFRQTIALTPLGQDVLAGRASHVALNGCDHWLGGVHLTPDNLYVFDPGTAQVLKA